MNKNILSILVTLLLNTNIGLSVEQGSAQDSAATVMIKVVHEDGFPIAGAEVKVMELNLITHTNDTGYAERAFTIPSEWRGREIHIITKHDNYYTPYLRSIYVEEGNQEFTIELRTLFLEGYIRDSQERMAIEGAAIIISDSAQPTLDTISNSEGHYKIKSRRLRCKLPPIVEIMVNKAGCISQTYNAIMTRDDNNIILNCSSNE